jgi:Smg protein
MKESVLDVLMYLFENYLDDEEEIATDRDTLNLELKEAGFGQVEVDKALAWLEDLAKLKETDFKDAVLDSRSIRVFTEQEIKKLDSQCRGFLMFLEQVGVLNHQTREMVIDRVMALESGEINLDQLKWVILMVLFNQPGEEEALAWMEDLVFDEEVGNLH